MSRRAFVVLGVGGRLRSKWVLVGMSDKKLFGGGERADNWKFEL